MRLMQCQFQGPTKNVSLLSGAELERCVQGAESNEAGDQEYPAEDEQYTSKNATDRSGKVQCRDNDRDHDADRSIVTTHVEFHLVRDLLVQRSVKACALLVRIIT